MNDDRAVFFRDSTAEGARQQTRDVIIRIEEVETMHASTSFIAQLYS